MDTVLENLIATGKVLLDSVDYTERNCGPTELVGAVLPEDVLQRFKDAIKAAEATR